MSILTIILHCLRKSERIIVKRRSLFNYSGEFRSPVPPSVTPTPHTVLSSPTNTSEMTVQMEPERVSTLIELQKAQIISIFDDGKTKPSRKTDDIKDTEQMDVHTSSSVPVPDIKKKSVIQEKLHKSIVKAQQTLPDAHAFNKRVEKKLHGRQVQNLVLEEE
ncbi:unnamed protein product [Didymodactylos carnosus]|uniref:Uncharacterized protein n=1 Tax=Didymodactylos carnosus TaxID=1234261 RepID=A0A814AUV5_9BILA|nr:unnamed protein product [Didymodactylos carnosus]CAF1223491.1 unnamed protein product [Didymodactylos carnosus]CAF3698927.1 unnamed protein product [Didymodactylos carnosus]CAF4031789.1 unnamed protein product [Didymodactylos carnosus]